jgi:hypothetical protein
MSLPFTHVVKIDGEAIKKFRSLKEAKWFIMYKSDATIEKLDLPKLQKKVDVFAEYANLLGEPLF